MVTITASNAGSAHARPGFLARVGSALWSGFMVLANFGPMSAEVRRLNDTTDEQLAARGTNRAAEVQRIFGARMGL
jgi:hypothetical protein